MDFKQINGTWIGFRDDPGEEILLGKFVEAEGRGDDVPYFYFSPAPDQLLSCRDCRKAAAKLSELNSRAPGNGPEVICDDR